MISTMVGEMAPRHGDSGMRRFSSYGPPDKDLHYYVARNELVRKARHLLMGTVFDKGGHYITAWAPRQTGKTWVMNEVLSEIRSDGRCRVLKLNLEPFQLTDDTDRIASRLARSITERLGVSGPTIRSLDELDRIFVRSCLKRPLILVLDEVDALSESAIAGLSAVFRHIYIRRLEENRPSAEKEYLLHGLALVGVRSVLGIENLTGSPFNIQRSLHIPNLNAAEVAALFAAYTEETGHPVASAVVERIYRETLGQPGLVSWLGELLTEGYEDHRPDRSRPLSPADFESVYADAVEVLPNNNVMNIISKARKEPYRGRVLELFKTSEKVPFRFDDPVTGFLYTNGVVDREREGRRNLIRFSCPFIQRRLFGAFSHDLFPHVGAVYSPFEDVGHIVTETSLNPAALLRRYEAHIRRNRDWMFSDAPRRGDFRIYEAVFHFSLYEYLIRFFDSYPTRVWPEFPTGNGRVDILIDHGGRLHAVEVKSYTDRPGFDRALTQAAAYGCRLGLERVHLAVFVESIDEKTRSRHEVAHLDSATGVRVTPTFIQTG